MRYTSPSRGAAVKSIVILSEAKDPFVCARHGRGLMGWKSPAEEIAPTASRRQGRHREVGSGGSRRQTCEPMNKNRIGGAAELGELARRSEARGYPKGGGVDAAVAQGRSTFLPGETCSGALGASRTGRGGKPEQESAEGIVPGCVAKRSDWEGPNVIWEQGNGTLRRQAERAAKPS